MNRCARCDRRVFLAEKKLAADKVWHAFCFSCVCCRKLLNTCSVCTSNGELYCARCYRRLQNSGRSTSGSSLSDERDERDDRDDLEPEDEECLPSCPGAAALGYSHTTDNRSCCDYLRPCQLGKTKCYQEGCPGWCGELPAAKPGDVIAVHVVRRCGDKSDTEDWDMEKSREKKSHPTSDEEKGGKYPTSVGEGKREKSNERRAKEQRDGCNSRSCFMPAPRDISSYYSRQHSIHTCDRCFPFYETCDCTGGYSAVYFKKNVCRRCGKKVFNAEKMVAGGGVYHDCCFTCYVCRKPLQMLCLAVHSGEIYCKHCYSTFFGVIGYGYGMVYTQ